MTNTKKTAFITGTNRGIGKALLEEFAQKEMSIFAHTRKETKEFVEHLKMLENQNKIKITPLYFDLTDIGTMKKTIISEIIKQKKSVDVLVNSAGIISSGYFYMTPIEKIKEVFNINLFSQMELTQLILKVMIKQKSGSIINIGSVGGLDAGEANTAYACSKAALMTWTKTLAKEYGKIGIRTNSIAPGLIKTDMKKEINEETQNQMIQVCALKRMGEPDEVAKIASFLASEESSYINGQIIRVDGGCV